MFIKTILSMKKKMITGIIVLTVATLTCNTTDPPLEPELKLELEDVSCTEAWITLTTTNLQLPTTLELKLDNQTRSIINLIKSDTLLYIDSLLPNNNYRFHSVIQSSNHTSNEISVTTLDTTSHNFTFETWTFGDIGSSVLFDVAIISEDNIWCVGEINIADTSVNGYTTYNAVHWNGSEWQLKRIFFPTVCGSSNLTSYPAKAIFVFDNDEVWITSSGDKIAILKNGEQINKFCLPSNVSMSINKIWGKSSNDLYVVGNNGSIAHYNGTQWTIIESWTELHFLDIYGATDPKSGEQQILVVGTRDLPLRQGIFSIKENTATQISSYPIQWGLYSVWFIPNRHYYAIGDGIYEKVFLSDSLWKNKPLDITSYGTSRIRGNGLNDVFAVGAFGECLHFNGVTWKSYINETGWFNGAFFSVYSKNNLIVAVGYESAQAKIMLGRRIN